MDDSRAAMVIAYHHIRERYNQLRTDHNRLRKRIKAQACASVQPVCIGIGNHISQGSEQITESSCTASSGSASLPCANGVKEATDVENRQECTHNDVVEVDILSICWRIECLAVSPVDVSNSLLDIAVQLRNIADRVSQPTSNTTVNEIRTGGYGSIVQSENFVELPLSTSTNTISVEVKQGKQGEVEVVGSCIEDTTGSSSDNEELVGNSGVNVYNLDDDFLLGK